MNKIVSGVVGIVMAIVFLAAGVFTLVTGIGHLQKLNAGKFVETQATITKIETMEVSDDDAPGGIREDYEITVEYTVDGKKVVSQLRETPKEFYEGMELTVIYNMDKPTDVTLPGTTGAYIMIGMGVVGIIVGLVLILNKIRGR